MPIIHIIIGDIPHIDQEDRTPSLPDLSQRLNILSQGDSNIGSLSPLIEDHRNDRNLQPMTPEFKKILHVNYTFLLIIYLLITDFVLSNRTKWFIL